jgi:hypothetical protein
MRTILTTLLLGMGMSFIPATSSAQFGVAVVITTAPPDLPIYDQPLCPGDGYIWAPGYWAWGDDDYFWVPGTWVLAPEVGLLWTPGYWAWGGNGFVFYEGYWAPVIGFYGGVNYGYGYFGHGYEGGRWDNGRFYYNRSVTNVNVTEVHNVYNTTVVNNTSTTRVSYNGGNGGINERPRPEEEAAARQRHIPPVAAQTQHIQTARANPQLRASANQGKPPVAATSKPAAFNDRSVVAAKQPGALHGPAPRAENNTARPGNSTARPENNTGRPENNNGRPENNGARSGGPVHPNDIPNTGRQAPPSTGDPRLDQRRQQEQEDLRAKQEQERQKLQQKQEQEHADEARKQQMEQQHQRETQQMEQKHNQEQERTQDHNQPQQRSNQPKPQTERP